MRKMLCLLLALLCLCGCRQMDVTETPSFETRETTEPSHSIPVAYEARYVRTNGYHDDVQYPRVVCVDNRQALEAYYGENREMYDLERKEQVYADTTIGFLDACDRYDDGYFEDQCLLIILLEEGSGSISHRVEAVELTTEGKLRVDIDRSIPEVCTADMAQWHILVEINRSCYTEAVQLYLSELLAWDGGYVAPPKPEAAFKKPPVGMVRSVSGEVELTVGGYHWIYENPDGTCTAVITDQAARPLPASSIRSLCMNASDTEGAYIIEPGEDYGKLAGYLGYLLKLNWEQRPTTVTCTKFMGNTTEEVYFDPDEVFYVTIGPAVYEFKAVWEDTGSGYWGEATYYLYIETVFTCE